ncbi:MAG: thioredoxin domain-containing protein [Alphaproteobacteria bacterium]|nr:thioredoxin domain-containing protein [Alphaproteobacteria bacterium]MDA8004066.1 thioredoxin domain-containing protein [Alphaproteobacteria bacterium]MDA8006128.1 thioredoxin domain-containing protein [Alphaproteobacteria bacterium]MDA8013120.1 thioredoxin domain-containing protein [Alphaproteobacteria bacterium]
MNSIIARNRLAGSSSLYLRLHADNPVHWMPWGDEPFALARELDRPVLLSSGYAACHWCHVMARESFSDPQMAQLLNQYFVSVKLDREQHPEVDALYIEALARLGQPGGWPLNLFLTPDGRPFLGGTYWPPRPSFGRPAFRQVVAAVANAWLDPKARAKLLAQGQRLHDALAAAHSGEATSSPSSPVSSSPSPSPSARERLDGAARRLLALEDKEHGGVGGAPKFPNAPFLNLWLWSASLGDGESARALGAALEGMARGGIYDHFGGGFARYATDPRWHIPHFEKMLYDNALLLRLYADAAPLLSDAARRRAGRVVAGTVRFLMRDFCVRARGLPGAGLAASLDAESDHREGAHYAWRHDDVLAALGAAHERVSETDARRFCRLYDITPAGNWAGAEHELGAGGYSVPHRLEAREDDDFEFGEVAEFARGVLLARRCSSRHPPRPRRDPRVAAEWNGMAVVALAEIGQRLGDAEILRFARETFEFARHALAKGEGDDGVAFLAHSWSGEEVVGGDDGDGDGDGEPRIHDGRAEGDGLLEDYAWMAEAALALFAAGGDAEDLRLAERWLEAARFLFRDAGGRWRRNVESPLLMGLSSHQDGPAPAPLAALVSAMARLGLLTGEARWSEAAADALVSAEGSARSDPLERAGLLAARLVLERGSLAVLAVPDDGGEAAEMEARILRDAVFGVCCPGLVLLEGFERGVLSETHPAAAAVAIDGRPALYVCRGGVCSPPIISDDAAEIRALLT